MKPIITMITLALLAQTVLAAPDTPPSLTWEIALAEPSGSPCNQFDPELTKITHVRVGKGNIIYTLESCNGNPHDSSVLRRVSPEGIVLWTREYRQGTGSVDPLSLDVDPANRAWVWYNDATHSPDPTLTLLVVDKDNNLVFVRSNNEFSSSSSVVRTSFNETSATSFRAFAGAGLSRIAYDCTGSLTCTELFEVTGDPGAGMVHYGGPYNTILYGWDNNAGTFQVEIINQDTGTILDSESAADTVQAFLRIWINGGTPTRLVIPYSRIDGGLHEPRWFEQNAATLANIQTVSSPIEHKPPLYDELSSLDSIVDGEGNVFFCGTGNTAGVRRDSFLIKYNNTAFPGQRWNITFSKEAAFAQVDGATTCDIAPDGAIYLGTVACANADSQCRTYLRKYAGAGIGRTPQSVFSGFNATTTTPPSVGGAVGFHDFCVLTGFTDDAGKFLCGLVIVISGSVLIAFVLANRNEKGMARLGNVSLFGAGGTFFGLAIFVTVIDLWPTYTTVLMIVLTAAVITLVVKRQFLTGG